MILLYPIVLVAAGNLMWRERSRLRLTGIVGFAVWIGAGALFFFSYLTGFSIGLLILPAAAGAVIFAAVWAPGPREAFGFFAGVGAICLLIAYINRHPGDLDPRPWSIVGAALIAAALLVFALWRAPRQELPGV